MLISASNFPSFFFSLFYFPVEIFFFWPTLIVPVLILMNIIAINCPEKQEFFNITLACELNLHFP